MHKTLPFIPRAISKNVRRDKNPASVVQLITPESRDQHGLVTAPDTQTCNSSVSREGPTVSLVHSDTITCISDIDPAIIDFRREVTPNLGPHNTRPLTSPNFPPNSFVEALTGQLLVDVGSLSPKRKVPFYHRQTRPTTGCLPSPATRSTSAVPARQYCHSPQGPVVKKSRIEVSAHSSKARHWEYTDRGRQFSRHRGGKDGVDFTVMSYNVLAQKLIEDNPYLYEHCSRHTLSWKARKRLLLAEIRYHKPDVICLQEVQAEHYQEFYEPQIHSLGYKSSYLKRSGDKPDGCATFYNKSRFTLDQAVPLKYFVSRNSPVLDRDNVALIVKLRPVSRHVPNTRRLCVANTHLLFNPRRGDVKLAQIMLLLAELDRNGYMYNTNDHTDTYHPMVVCGDFNSEPNSDVYKLLTLGRLRYEGLLCRTISGQQEGMNRGRDVYLDRNFFPENIGITDTCQYKHDVVRRVMRLEPITYDNMIGDDVKVMDSNKLQPEADDCIVLEDITDIRHREKSTSISQEPEVIVIDDIDTGATKCSNQEKPSVVKQDCSTQKSNLSFSQGTGTLTHDLKLVSCYPQTSSHEYYEDRKVTTLHTRGDCIVDYIFYGVRNREVRFRHGEVEMRRLVEGHLNLLGSLKLLTSRELWKIGGLPNENCGSDHLPLMARFLLK